ncbi:sel1 repeat family protein [Pelomyxa schiedti]|nr:sel1 repeat family protein [Pelomyxa schiedti]
MMLEALAQLELGNIYSALGLVANATSMFGGDGITDGEEPEAKPLQECKYLPGLMFIHCLRCVFNDHVALHQHIPKSLSLAFSHSLGCSTTSMKAHCMSVLNLAPAEVIAEWHHLVISARRASQQSPATEQQWAALYFVGLWRTYCSDIQCTCYSAVPVWEELSSKIPTEHASCPLGHMYWWASSLAHLGHCYLFGLGGVVKDMNRAVTLYQRSADAGSSLGMVNIAVCFGKGEGVEKDSHHAVALFERASEASDTIGMYNLGVCWGTGSGVDHEDMPNAVRLFQRASDAGNAMAMFNLGVCCHMEKDTQKAVALYQRATDAGISAAMYSLGECYYNGTGVDQDSGKAVALWEKAADLGNEEAVARLRELEEPDPQEP